MKQLQSAIHNVDARKIANYFQDEVIQTSITSPPYFDMKDYGSENQIGFGQTYDQYLEDLKTVFSSIYKATKPDGTLWIVIDTFKDKEGVVPLPFDLASKLKDIGWKLQDIIIWKKDKTTPWSSTGFVQRKFEYILFLSKSKTFKYHQDDVRLYDTKHLKQWWVRYPERYNPKGKALDEVWEYPIPTQGSWGKEYIRHFCPLPTDMVGNIIQLSTDEGDIVLDPFSGSGSVLVQAAYMNRKYIGFELNTEYINMFRNYLKETLDNGQKNFKLIRSDSSKQDEFNNMILKLRSLKYARILYQKLGKILGNNPIEYIFVEDIGQSTQRHKLKKYRYSIIFSQNSFSNDKLLQDITSIIAIPPLSKFGIEPLIEIKNKLINPIIHNLLYGYTATNTHCTIGEVNIFKIPKEVVVISPIKVDLDESDYV